MRRLLMYGAVIGGVAVVGFAGAIAFAPGLGLAQDDGENPGAVKTFGGWCVQDSEGPFAVAAEAIGIPQGDLIYAVGEGKTIADVARDNDIDVRVVVDAIVAAMQERLDAAVEDGFYSHEVADEIAAGFEDQARAIVNGELPVAPPGPGRGIPDHMELPFGGDGPVWGTAGEGLF